MSTTLLHILSGFGLATSAGLNAYIPLLAIALLGKAGAIELTAPYDTLEHPIVIGVLVVLLLIEFFADKIPAVNHINDIIQTIIRPAAGVVAFGASTGAVSGVDPIIAVVCGLLLAGSVHAAKSVVVRPAVTVTTAGLGNPVVSTIEDIVAAVVSFLAIVLPWLMLLVLLLLLVMVVSLLRRPARPSSSDGLGKYGGSAP